MKLIEPHFSAGFVPSLEVLPFLGWATGRGVKPQSCPGYGNLVRSLLTGDLQMGLLPWELFVTELLSLPGQTRNWKVPVVLKACPMELALSRSAWKQVTASKRRARPAGSLQLSFGVEARHSFTKQQILSWIDGLKMSSMGAPVFKVLPMHLMIKALSLGEVDGVLAPSPWGLQAELDGVGKVDPDFNVGEHAQHLVLVCSEEVSGPLRELPGNLAAEIRAGRVLNSDSESFQWWSAKLAEGGSPGLSQELFELALRRYPIDQLPDEFGPDGQWFEEQLGSLVRRRSIAMEPASIAEIAKALAF
ncbi:ABC transporter substrate-binding protein [Haloferula chungangensis]|uniref:ABC transporter substrate-binding protein n=1 Tax=Haloferula chungangensis TaxID=1048331 RepID=A0ABW2LC05_9BACT